MSWLAVVPVQPDRSTAREWAVRELSRPEYQQAKPGLGERVLTWAWHWINDLDVGGGAPPVVALVLITLVVAGVVTYAVHRAGGLHPTARRKALAVLPQVSTSAADHRAAAQRHLDAQQWDLAVVEWFRAIARELEERALLTPQPGRTAVEVARDGGTALPELATDLLAGAHQFDDVSYGHLTVGESAARALRELDDRVRAARAVSVR